MADYVDGFVIPLPKKHLNASRRLAQKAGEVWRDHGALDLKEKQMMYGGFKTIIEA